MDRRTFLRSVILGTLAAPLVTRRQALRANGVLVEPITFKGHRVIWDGETGIAMRLDPSKWRKGITHVHPRYLGTISSL